MHQCPASMNHWQDHCVLLTCKSNKRSVVLLCFRYRSHNSCFSLFACIPVGCASLSGLCKPGNLSLTYASFEYHRPGSQMFVVVVVVVGVTHLSKGGLQLHPASQRLALAAAPIFAAFAAPAALHQQPCIHPAADIRQHVRCGHNHADAAHLPNGSSRL